jgi:hypothetical protein
VTVEGPEGSKLMNLGAMLVAGHGTFFLTRKRDWMWSRLWTSLAIFIPLECTQIIGTLFAVYGILMTPIGWAGVGIAWDYAGMDRIVRRAQDPDAPPA